MKEEKSSSRIEPLVDIFNKNAFKIEYLIEFKEELCTLKEALVFHYLSRCKIWPTICKQLKKSNGKEYKLRCLIQWFTDFSQRLGIKDMFELDALSKRDLKTVTKKKLISSSNSELIDAVTNRNYEKVIELLNLGVDVESIEPPNERFQGVTKIRSSHLACDNGDLKMCQILTEYKVDWEAEDSEKMSPIFYAIKSGSMEMLRYLVENMKVDIEKL